MLFDWLMTKDLDSVRHPSRPEASLGRSAVRLEWPADADVTEATAEDIAAAQNEAVRDMGW
ncbi:hypothetical protein ABT275_45445 [Streptomyces sp. NPDC001185]|uniref:hypothetical protein n=1 Tax=Streptomyces sp. NPDC001185 TaxID=3154380 RepID=UPI0033181AF7